MYWYNLIIISYIFYYLVQRMWISQWLLQHIICIISHHTRTKGTITKFCQEVPMQYVYHYLPSTCEGSESLRVPTRLGSVRSSIIRLSSSKSSSSTSLIPETIKIQLNERDWHISNMHDSHSFWKLVLLNAIHPDKME